MNTMTNRLSVSIEVLLFVMHIDSAVVSICQDIVDKSSPWNSESASHARSLQLALLLLHSPCFSLRRPVHHLGRSQSRRFPSLVGLHLFHLIFGRPLFLFPGIFVLNSFLSVCSSSLLVICPYLFDIPSVIF